MRIALFTLLAFAAVAVQATDVTCPKNRWQTTITLEAGDKFKYRTQAGRVYRGPVKCTVNYKLGNTCAKARFWCNRSFIHNEDRRSCSRGDKMIVRAGNTKKTNCGKRRARVNAFGQINVSFLANKRGRDRGAICNVECTRSVPVSVPGKETSDVLLVVGGYDGNIKLNKSEVYGSPTCSVPDLPTGKDAVKAVYFDSQVLACSGNSPSGADDFLCYKLGATGWSEHSNMTSERYFGSPVVVGGSLYMLGGYGGVERYSSVVLAAGSNVWVPGPNIPGATYRSCAVALGDGFVIIGSSDSDYATQVLQYDGSSWGNWANLTTGRQSHSCLLFGDSIIVAGGYVNYDHTATTVIIDTVTKLSSSGPDMAMPRNRFVFANVNNLLLAVGGYNGFLGYSPTGEIFDPVNGGTLDQNMTTGRSYLNEGAVVPKGFLAAIIGCP